MWIYGYLVFSLAWIITVPLLILEIVALADAIRHPEGLYIAYDKQNKGLWISMLGLGLIGGIISLPIVTGPNNIFLAIIAMMPAAVYMAGVKPVLGGRR